MVMSDVKQAPGELARVQEFVNTLDIEREADRLTSPGALAEWLEASGLADPGLVATEADLANAIGLREALRAVLLAHNEDAFVPADVAAILDAAASRSRMHLRFGRTGAGTLESDAEGVDGALGRLLAIIHRSAADDSWDRLKACREHSCEWAFYDHTKNRSGTWCDMRVCGNRAKARAYRERRGADAGVQG
jgi:predicted RNA-binding Zn ribbon-like protein